MTSDEDSLDYQKVHVAYCTAPYLSPNHMFVTIDFNKFWPKLSFSNSN